MATKVTDKGKGAAADPSIVDPPVPTPTFVPADEFKQFQASINGQFQQFNDNFNAVLAELRTGKGSPTPSEPAVEDVSVEELDKVLENGKGADKILKAIDARMKKMEGVWGKRVGDLESIGLTAISEHSKELATGDMPYYSKFKKEIDAYVATLPAHLRVNKQVYVVAHNAIVGQHLPEILKEEKEKILREAADPDVAAGVTGINGRDKGTKKDTVPTVEELLGKPAADALISLGRTPDQQAARLGYKDWTTYAAFIKAQEEATKADA